MDKINVIKVLVISKIILPLALAFYFVNINNVYISFFLPIACVGLAMDILYRNLDLFID